MEIVLLDDLKDLTLLEFQGDFTKYKGTVTITDDVIKVGNQTIKEKSQENPKFLYRINKETLEITGKVGLHRKFTERPHLNFKI